MICTKKYVVFIPISGTELLKNPWNFLSGKNDKDVFCHVNDTSFCNVSRSPKYRGWSPEKPIM